MKLIAKSYVSHVLLGNFAPGDVIETDDPEVIEALQAGGGVESPKAKGEKKVDTTAGETK